MRGLFAPFPSIDDRDLPPTLPKTTRPKRVRTYTVIFSDLDPFRNFGRSPSTARPLHYSIYVLSVSAQRINIGEVGILTRGNP
jgi:hypothetical protein